MRRFRPSEIVRPESGDVLRFLDLQEPFLLQAVGKGHPVKSIPLPAEGVAAWKDAHRASGLRTVPVCQYEPDWKAAMKRPGERELLTASKAGADEAALDCLLVSNFSFIRTGCDNRPLEVCSIAYIF